MSAPRALRVPLQMAAQGSLRNMIRPAVFRAAVAAPYSTKSATTQSAQKEMMPLKNKWFAAPPAPGKNMVSIKSAMPQLVPFYFMNEVVFGMTIIPLLVYTFSKYILPRNLRTFASRVFISKL